ncbi:hypothetical protein BDR04DRAFT_1098400 [Suillus decipiens]|nr:hypothetical protein BDR04DRAFT_1098400 [Suillus decipiens]
MPHLEIMSRTSVWTLKEAEQALADAPEHIPDYLTMSTRLPIDCISKSVQYAPLATKYVSRRRKLCHDLCTDSFSHEQLYTALSLSRVRCRQDIQMLFAREEVMTVNVIALVPF